MGFLKKLWEIVRPSAEEILDEVADQAVDQAFAELEQAIAEEVPAGRTRNRLLTASALLRTAIRAQYGDAQ